MYIGIEKIEEMFNIIYYIKKNLLQIFLWQYKS